MVCASFPSFRNLSFPGRPMLAVILAASLLSCIESTEEDGDYEPVAYYVDAQTGDDESSGLSQGEAWRTVARANAAELRPGDSVLFRSGQFWREPVSPPASGKATAPILYSSYGSGPPPLFLGTVEIQDWMPTANPEIVLTNLSYQAKQVFVGPLRLSEIEFTSAGQASMLPAGNWSFDEQSGDLWVHHPDGSAASTAIEVSEHPACFEGNGQNHIVVQGLAFERSRVHGLSTGGGNHWNVNNTTSRENFRNGLNAGQGSKYVLFEGALAEDNGIGFGGHDVSHLTIRNCISRGNEQREDADGIAVSWSDNVLIEGNSCSGNSYGGSADGIQAAGCQDVEIRHNLVYDVSNGGIILTDSNEPSSGRIYGNVVIGGKDSIILKVDEGITHVFNNSLWNDEEGGIKVSEVFGVASVVLENNAVQTSGRCLIVPSPLHLSVESMNNVLYTTGPNFVTWGTVTYEDGDSLADSGAELGSIFAEPMYVNPLVNDLRLQPGSPCIDVGSPAPFTLDFLGSPVPLDGNADGAAFPDVGAIEFTGV